MFYSVSSWANWMDSDAGNRMDASCAPCSMYCLLLAHCSHAFTAQLRIFTMQFRHLHVSGLKCIYAPIHARNMWIMRVSSTLCVHCSRPHVFELIRRLRLVLFLTTNEAVDRLGRSRLSFALSEWLDFLHWLTICVRATSIAPPFVSNASDSATNTIAL